MFLKRTIPIREIVSAKIEHVNALKRFGGVGYRINTKGEIGFILKSGNCLVIKTTKETYVISFHKMFFDNLLNNGIFKVDLQVQ